MKPLTIVSVDNLPEFSVEVPVETVLPKALAELSWPDGSVGLSTGDIVVVTSKIISKSEGQIVSAADRETAIDQEAVRLVASRTVGSGPTSTKLRIVETHHGFVMAAAGVDSSDLPAEKIALLPKDPDASARRLRTAIQQQTTVATHLDPSVDSIQDSSSPRDPSSTSKPPPNNPISPLQIGVIITDSAGRPWRDGIIDFTIGAAGVRVLDDLRGTSDRHGNKLDVTVTCLADEIAAAAELATPKATGLPVAVIRGLDRAVLTATEPDLGAAVIVRKRADDLFRLGTAEALSLGRQQAVSCRRTIRAYTSQEVPRTLIETCVAAAISAPAPHHTEPWHFIALYPGDEREALLTAMRERWVTDLRNLDNFSEESIAKRIKRGDLLFTAPVVVLPFMKLNEVTHEYPDDRRCGFERDLFMVAGGAAVENFLVAASSYGLGTAWISSTMFCPDLVTQQLGLPSAWQPLGAIGVGYPDQEPKERADRSPGTFLEFR